MKDGQNVARKVITYSAYLQPRQLRRGASGILGALAETAARRRNGGAVRSAGWVLGRGGCAAGPEVSAAAGALGVLGDVVRRHLASREMRSGSE